MSNITALLAFLLLPFSISWGPSAMANDNGAQATHEAPVATLPACEIRVDESGSSIVLEGVVFADADLDANAHQDSLAGALTPNAVATDLSTCRGVSFVILWRKR